MSSGARFVTRPVYTGFNPFKLLESKLPPFKGHIVYHNIVSTTKETSEELGLYKTLKDHEFALRAPLIRYNLFCTYIWLANYHIMFSSNMALPKRLMTISRIRK